MPPQQAAHSFWSDASGTWGCGALNDDLPWFKVQWPESWQQIHIAAKEMVPVVLAVAIWGPGSSLCSLIGLGTRPPPHASVTVLAFLHSTLPDSHPSSAHSRCT